KTARSSRAGRQNRSARGGRSVERYLRNGFSRILLWVSARTQPAPSAGRALYGTADEKGELGARFGYSQLFRWAFPRMAGEIHRAPDRRSARRAIDPEMAQRGRAGGGETDTSGGRNAPGREGIALACQRLPALRVRPLGPSVASKTGARRCHRRAFRRRYRGWISEQGGGRPVSGGTYRENKEVQSGTASRENATSGVRSVCDRPTAVAWRRETGDVQLPRTYTHLCEEEEQWTVHGVAADDPQTAADEAERGESRASATNARTHPRTRQVAAGGCGWTHSLLRSAHEPTGAGAFSIPSRLVLASLAVAAEPERPRSLGPHAAPHHPLAAFALCLSSLS